MPVGDNGQYIAPTFVNNNAPALDADEMNGMAGAAIPTPLLISSLAKKAPMSPAQFSEEPAPSAS